MKTAFSLLDIDHIIRGAGAERVSEEASIRLERILEDEAHEVLFKAKIYARYAGRKTIRREDILLASKTRHKTAVPVKIPIRC
ncbi:MAG: histone [Candidatus Micrarchaeia archaeon]